MNQPILVHVGKRMGPITLVGNQLISTSGKGNSTDNALTPAGPQHVCGRFSTDDGQTWSEPRMLVELDPAPGAVSGAVPLGDPSGRLIAFFMRYYQFDWDTKDPAKCRCEMWCLRSPDAGRTWSAPQRIDFGHTYTGAINCVCRLTSGRILLPLSYLSDRAEGKFVSTVVYSDDHGRTWQRSSNDVAVSSGGALDESGACEPVVAGLFDGRVWMVIRTQTGYLHESFSEDDGVTWSPAQPTVFRSSNSPAGLLRLRDGRLIIAWNNCYGEPFRGEKRVSYARQVLHAAISKDDGKTFSPPVQLIGRTDDDPLDTEYTYPFLCQAPSGQVLLIYYRVSPQEGRGWNCPECRLMRFDADWLLATSA